MRILRQAATPRHKNPARLVTNFILPPFLCIAPRRRLGRSPDEHGISPFAPPPVEQPHREPIPRQNLTAQNEQGMTTARQIFTLQTAGALLGLRAHLDVRHRKTGYLVGSEVSWPVFPRLSGPICARATF